MTVRVLLADDQPLVRAALKMVITDAPDLELAGEAGNGAEAVALAEELRPDVVVMDLRMPVLDGIEATRQITSGPVGPHVIVLTTFDEDENVHGALRAGASGFLVKDTPPPEIAQAVRRVAAGEPMLSPSVTRQLIRHVTDNGADIRRTRAREMLAQLTEREREVAVALGHGKSNAEISKELFISVATVKANVSRLLAKLELNNRTQVALLVHDAGLV